MPHTTAAPLRPLDTTRALAGPVVVAVGGNDPSAALRAARVFARQSPAGVLAIAVLEPLPIYAFGEEPRLPPPSFEEARQAALQARTEALVREASEEPGAWRVEVQLGDPAHVIADVAARERAPLIIMGIGRHNALDRLLQRETAIRTVRLARCPVLAVSGDFTDLPHNVIVGTDFSPESVRAAEIATTLMDETGKLIFVHAWQSTTNTDPMFAEVIAHADDEYERGLPARFEHLRAAVPGPIGGTTRDIACRGDAARELVHHAEDLKADLIAVGRHGMGALERLLVGSVTSAVLRRSKCSVLIAPTPSAADMERLALRATGKSESSSREAWPALLARFTIRNRTRPTRLEVDDPDLGAQTQENGYPFGGAAYDPHDDRIELMFGDPVAGTIHLSRGITSPQSLTMHADEHGVDTGLTITHGRGETFLRFTAPVATN